MVTTEYSDWATNCPEYKVTAVEVRPRSRPLDRMPQGSGDGGGDLAEG